MKRIWYIIGFVALIVLSSRAKCSKDQENDRYSIYNALLIEAIDSADYCYWAFDNVKCETDESLFYIMLYDSTDIDGPERHTRLIGECMEIEYADSLLNEICFDQARKFIEINKVRAPIDASKITARKVIGKPSDDLWENAVIVDFSIPYFLNDGEYAIVYMGKYSNHYGGTNGWTYIMVRDKREKFGWRIVSRYEEWRA